MLSTPEENYDSVPVFSRIAANRLPAEVDLENQRLDTENKRLRAALEERNKQLRVSLKP